MDSCFIALGHLLGGSRTCVAGVLLGLGLVQPMGTVLILEEDLIMK